ncbi:MAG: serine hydrolase domain-containing protein [Pirellulales bacterium]
MNLLKARPAIGRFAVAVCILFAARWASAETIAKLPAPLAEQVEARVSEEMSRVGVPAISIAVAVDGELRYANGFGHADVENSVPARADSLYRTASIAKPMTSAVVLQLAEAGKLDLDAPVQAYCSEFPAKKWPVTSRQLLGHLGGVRHYNGPSEQYETRHFYALKSALPIFADGPLLHEPGTEFHYTSFGFNLLGMVAEGAAKRERL